MSKIALTPNASGTGTFTLAAPNSNTSRTITLPDEAGEVLVNGTNQNVGIGTSSPTAVLDVRRGDADGKIAEFHNNVGYGIDIGSSTADAYISSGYQQNFLFKTNAGAGQSERMRIDLNGALLLGTTSRSIYYNSTNVYNASAVIKTNVSNEIADLVITNGNNNFGSAVEFARTNSAGNDVRFASISAQPTNNTAGSEAGVIRFYTKDTGDSNIVERARLDASGNLLVGTTSLDSAFSGVQLRPTVSVFSSTSDVAYFRRNLSNGGVLIFQRDATVVGSVTVTGSATSYNTSSDYRLKTDAQPMTGASARVQALKPVNFEWIANGTRVDGFLAHEAQEIVPEAVTGTKDAMRDEEYEVTPAVYEDVVIPAVLDEDGNELEAERTEQQLVTEAVMGTRSVPDYQGIDQSKLVPLLTAALQEALTEISDLKARVTALEAV